MLLWFTVFVDYQGRGNAVELNDISGLVFKVALKLFFVCVGMFG